MVILQDSSLDTMNLSRPLVVASAVVFALVVFASGVRVAVRTRSCNESHAELSRDAKGYVVQSTFAACTIFGTTVVRTIELISPSGRREVLARYVPWDGRSKRDGTLPTGPFHPSASWTSPDSLHVSLGVIDALNEKRTNVEGFEVSYEAIEVHPSK
jgi:hypothetical protein